MDINNQVNPPNLSEQQVSQITTSSHALLFKKGLFIISIVIVVTAVGLGGYFLGLKNTNKPVQQTATVSNPSPTTTITNTPTPTTIPASYTKDIGANQKKYVSPKLGISFLYEVTQGEETMSVKEIDDKIYINSTRFLYTTGQYVQEFQKSPTDSLDQAITKQFLSNYSPFTCFIKAGKPDANAQYPSNYVVDTIGYPNTYTFFNNKCPQPYTESNGLSYFLMDTKHPNIFLFFYIGQQPIIGDSTTNKTWQDTITFLN